ncbi:hypothetical protein [Cypionkella sp.]|uniref:hypothetical protein n=1 Tax=Cypionkella sp. TaxID=2811411 RepID=UPI002723B7A8|nr:hypothetical protein [Cypionkella sp.]MDO8983029.1 hypothetical protein [Cypionkella sp.]
MTEFAFDIALRVSLRLKADTVEQALAMLRAELDSTPSNFGAWPDGTPILGEASLAPDLYFPALYEVDGEAV